MKTNAQVLKIAQSHLGEGGSRFRKFAGLPAGAAWCNAFVDYVANEGGVKSLYFYGRKETYCPHSIKWCEANLAQIPLYLALPCDIIYFDWEKNGVPNHIGLVRAKNSPTSIHTIEGNTNGGKVAQKLRSGKYVQAVYRPHFVPEKVGKAKLKGDGSVGYYTIYNLQLALGMKPSGILTKETVKFLQKRAGATADGAWGPATSKKVQKMIGANADGVFGKNSVVALQKWINSINYPSAKKKPAETKPASPASTKKPQSKPTATKHGYTGKFPELNNNVKIVNSLAHRHCYPYGTPEKKYKYSTGHPTEAYKKGIDEAYPNHKNWPNKKQRAGACCDVFVGEVLGHVGITAPKDLKNQLVQFPKMSKLKSNGHYLAKDFRMGDVVQRGRKDKSGHTWIVCELINGQRYIANAHYKKLKGCYAVMDAKPKNIVRSKWKYYKCYTVQGAIRTWYGLHDYGYDVLYIQQFLKWAGYYNGKLDGGYGEYTKSCVARFQKAVGLGGDGCVGELTIKKMKAFKK